MKSLRGKGILMFFGMIAMMAVSMCVLFLPPVAIAESDSLLAAQSENGGNGEWIVKWVSDPEPAILDHAQLIATDPQTRTWVIRPDSTIDIPGWLAKWRQSQGVAYIQPNYIVKTYATTSNDPLLKKQDYLNQIKAYQAWDKVTGNENIIIAIVDTGVDLNHPDLKDNLVDGINLLATNAPPEDDNGHGTQLAGILAARGGNQIGISGVLWKAKVMPIKVLDKNGEGDDFIVAKGIRYAADKGAKIILMSSGIPTYSANMEEAVAYAQKRGVLVVAATGNEGDRVNYPAAFPGVIAVGGVNSKDQWSSFSNYGAEVDMVAPAEKIYTTNNQGFYDYATGTSMAAPQVAGAAALIWALHPNDTADQVRQRLRQSADDLGTPGWNNKTGYGRLNLYRAVSENLSSDIYEPNDRMGKAAIIPINKTINAKLSSDDDVDWFKVNVPYNGLLTWDVQLVKQLDYGIRMELYMPNNPTPILYRVNHKRSISANVPSGPLYYRLIYDAKENEPGGIPYAIKQTFKIGPDHFEPNNQASQAYQLPLKDQTITGSFHTDGDQDWYQLTRC
jgi:subtilisin family serine protease